MSGHEVNTDAEAWVTAHRIGQLLRQARLSKGLNIEDVHQDASLSVKHYGNIERGQRKVSGETRRVDARAATLAHVALRLGVKSADLASAGRPDAAEQLERLLTEAKAAEHQEAREHIAWLRRLRLEAKSFGEFIDLVVEMTNTRADESTVDSTEG